MTIAIEIAFAAMWLVAIALGYAMVLLGGFDDDDKVSRYFKVAMYSALHTMICVWIPAWMIFS